MLSAVPVTFAWRDELEKKTQNALHRAMGNIPPPSRGGLLSRSSQRGASQFDTLGDNQVSTIGVNCFECDGNQTFFFADFGFTLPYSTN